jgi:hypothetical protein
LKHCNIWKFNRGKNIERKIHRAEGVLEMEIYSVVTEGQPMLRFILSISLKSYSLASYVLQKCIAKAMRFLKPVDAREDACPSSSAATIPIYQ